MKNFRIGIGAGEVLNGTAAEDEENRLLTPPQQSHDVIVVLQSCANMRFIVAYTHCALKRVKIKVFSGFPVS